MAELALIIQAHGFRNGGTWWIHFPGEAVVRDDYRDIFLWHTERVVQLRPEISAQLDLYITSKGTDLT